MDEQLPNPFDPANNIIDNDILVGVTNEIENPQTENHPNFPSFWPLVYHNINIEIQQRYSFLVRMCYFAALSITYCCFWSVVASFFSYSIKDNKSSMSQDIITSITMCVIIPIVIFYMEYYKLYVALRDGTSLHGNVLINLFVVFITGAMICGFRGSGFIGIQYTMLAFKYGSVINRIFGLFITIWEIFNFVLQLILLFQINEISSKMKKKIPNEI